jgi:hypothetical protein
VDVAWVDGIITHGAPPPTTPLGTTTFTSKIHFDNSG